MTASTRLRLLLGVAVLLVVSGAFQPPVGPGRAVGLRQPPRQLSSFPSSASSSPSSRSSSSCNNRNNNDRGGRGVLLHGAAQPPLIHHRHINDDDYDANDGKLLPPPPPHHPHPPHATPPPTLFLARQNSPAVDAAVAMGTFAARGFISRRDGFSHNIDDTSSRRRRRRTNTTADSTAAGGGDRGAAPGRRRAAAAAADDDILPSLARRLLRDSARVRTRVARAVAAAVLGADPIISAAATARPGGTSIGSTSSSSNEEHPRSSGSSTNENREPPPPETPRYVLPPGGNAMDWRTWVPVGQEPRPTTAGVHRNQRASIRRIDDQSSSAASSPNRARGGGGDGAALQSRTNADDDDGDGDDALLTTKVKPGVAPEEIRGAALAGFGVAAAVVRGHAGDDDGAVTVPLLTLTLLAPVATALLAISRGTVGDVTRLVGRVVWDAANLAIAVYKRIDAEGTLPATVLENAWIVSLLTARGTKRKAREAVAFAAEFQFLQRERTRSIEAERTARALLQARLLGDAKVRTQRAVAARVQHAEDLARTEREHLQAERRARDMVHVAAREGLMRYRFQLAATQRRREQLAKRLVQRRVLQQVQLDMAKTAGSWRKQRDGDEPDTPSANEAAAAAAHSAGQKRSAMEADLVQRPDQIRRRTPPVRVVSRLGHRAAQVQRFLARTAPAAHTGRHSFVQRAAMHLVAASAPLFLAVPPRRRHTGDDGA